MREAATARAITRTARHHDRWTRHGTTCPYPTGKDPAGLCSDRFFVRIPASRRRESADNDDVGRKPERPNRVCVSMNHARQPNDAAPRCCIHVVGSLRSLLYPGLPHSAAGVPTGLEKWCVPPTAPEDDSWSSAARTGTRAAAAACPPRCPSTPPASAEKTRVRTSASRSSHPEGWGGGPTK